MSRPWLALVLVLFGLPLFLGLRSLDLETDEAIYSFAVDRILEVGEWLQPKSSPDETAVFLEKPPLKFWLVAAPIRAHVLPHDEFGLRFVDAAFGATSFLYVFAIGCLLAGPVCGAVAVLLLFVHWPLLLDHGIRTNNMEAALFLSHCGGFYHVLAWVRASGSRRVWHAVAAGLLFVLGFMTKFVAVAFLPVVAGAALLLFRSTRARLAADWRVSTAVAVLALALIAPWFIYAQVQFGALLWETMLSVHVYTRFTTALNPAHVHPWNYYVVTMAREFAESGLAWLVPAGLVTLLIQSIRRRSFEGTVVLLWATVPLALISLGASKLYHYAYPFLPPLAIAAGYLVALVWMLAPALVRKALAGAEDLVARFAPRVREAGARPALGAIGTAVVWLGSLMLVGALFFGQVYLHIGSTMLFKSSGMLRPLAAIVLASVLAHRASRTAPLVVALTLLWWMPVDRYKDTIRQMLTERHPLRDVSQCIQRVEASLGGGTPPGLYVDTDSSMWHPIYYYFRRIRPWTRQVEPSAQELDRRLRDPGAFGPSLVQEQRYRDYQRGGAVAGLAGGVTPPLISLFEYELLLPGPYGVCSPEAPLRAAPGD